MTITNKSIKLLWSNAAGRCSFRGCSKRLSVEQADGVTPYTLGEMAHIKGNKPGSNRYDEDQSAIERDSYENLILLCPTHHTLIDKPENETNFPVELLNQMKQEHEQFISTRLQTSEIINLEQLKDRIAPYLCENHQVWEQYGPISEIARKNPHSEQIYALWTTERLSTIVPNNREMNALLLEYRQLFSRHNQKIVSKFIRHVDSYEHWVDDKIPYNAVRRFPKDFEDLILGE